MYFDYLFEKVRSYANEGDDFERLQRACDLVRKLAAAELDMADATQLGNMTISCDDGVDAGDEPVSVTETAEDDFVADDVEVDDDGLFDDESADDDEDGIDVEPIGTGEVLEPLAPAVVVDNSDAVPEVVLRGAAEFDVVDPDGDEPVDDIS